MIISKGAQTGDGSAPLFPFPPRTPGISNSDDEIAAGLGRTDGSRRGAGARFQLRLRLYSLLFHGRDLSPALSGAFLYVPYRSGKSWPLSFFGMLLFGRRAAEFAICQRRKSSGCSAAPWLRGRSRHARSSRRCRSSDYIGPASPDDTPYTAVSRVLAVPTGTAPATNWPLRSG
jgi:hypothetical protein